MELRELDKAEFWYKRYLFIRKNDDEQKDNTNVRSDYEIKDEARQDYDPTLYDVSEPNPQSIITSMDLEENDSNLVPTKSDIEKMDLGTYKANLAAKYAERYGNFWRLNPFLITQFLKDVRNWEATQAENVQLDQAQIPLDSQQTTLGGYMA